VLTFLRPLHHDSACSGFTTDKFGTSFAAQSKAAAAIHDGQYSRKITSVDHINSFDFTFKTHIHHLCLKTAQFSHLFLPRIFDIIISVALEIRNPMKSPDGSSLQAKNAMKLNGVTERSRQSNTLSTSNSILHIVLGSNIYLAPST